MANYSKTILIGHCDGYGPLGKGVVKDNFCHTLQTITVDQTQSGMLTVAALHVITKSHFDDMAMADVGLCNPVLVAVL